jgi:uncharacterized Zn finger protein
MNCPKCAGLLVKDYMLTFGQPTVCKRCVNCGYMADPVFERNRMLQKEKPYDYVIS